jgi:hypothetical protein
MRKVIWIIAAFVIGAPVEAWACSCVPASPCSRFAAADAVFLGHVVAVGREGGYSVARLEVTRTWRGRVDSTVTVRQEAGSTCSFDVEVGDRFLVYGGGKGATFSTNICAGGGVVPDGEPDPTLPPPGGRVTGYVLRFNEQFTSRDDISSPMPGTRVSVETGAGVVETRTDGNGRFTLDGVPPGDHTIRTDVGSALEGEERFALRSVSDCASVVIMPRPSGRVSGNLTSTAGLPVKGTEIYAVPVEHDWSTSDLSDSRSTTARDDGAFEFSGLKPGRYWLMVNVVYPPRVSQPYPPTYYPGVENREEAVALGIGSGSAPPLAPFVLNRTLPRATIAAEIVCRDGSLPRSGLVYAKRTDGRSFFSESTYTKVDGHFQLTVMAGVLYDVYGEVLVPSRDATGREIGFSGLRTSEVRFDPATPPPVIRLIAPLDCCQVTTIDGSRR